MKKSCDGCKALLEIRKCNCVCNLGYKIKPYQKDVSIGQRGAIYVTDWKPIENCPKPRTYRQYAKLMLKNKG